MDIAALSMSLANIETQTQVGVAMLDKTMDVGESLSAGLVEMIDAAAMERSVHPELGANVDVHI
ncbi:MAG: YjfB family protein [Lachnospiraceae bacterium]|nr:YjfB family protein [Lachnospiraceae bacterium]